MVEFSNLYNHISVGYLFRTIKPRLLFCVLLSGISTLLMAFFMDLVSRYTAEATIALRSGYFFCDPSCNLPPEEVLDSVIANVNIRDIMENFIGADDYSLSDVSINADVASINISVTNGNEELAHDIAFAMASELSGELETVHFYRLDSAIVNLQRDLVNLPEISDLNAEFAAQVAIRRGEIVSRLDTLQSMASSFESVSQISSVEILQSGSYNKIKNILVAFFGAFVVSCGFFLAVYHRKRAEIVSNIGSYFCDRPVLLLKKNGDCGNTARLLFSRIRNNRVDSSKDLLLLSVGKGRDFNRMMLKLSDAIGLFNKQLHVFEGVEVLPALGSDFEKFLPANLDSVVCILCICESEIVDHEVDLYIISEIFGEHDVHVVIVEI